MKEMGPPPAMPIVVPDDFRIIAHRGASAHAPENTMAAFLKAEHMGAREIELDVQFTADRHLVICHDRTLDRYGHPGLIPTKMSLHELKALDMGSWFSSTSFSHERLLSLPELFRHFGSRFIYHVEIKVPAPDIERTALSMIKKYGLERFVYITSFHKHVLATVKRLSPSTPVGWLVKEGGLSSSNIARAVEIGCHQICPRSSDLTSDDVSVAHRSLAEVRAFAVKTEADVCRVVETGCNGLTVDDPSWLEYEKMKTSK